MSCDCPEPKNCCPTECRPTPEPILPLCDVALPDGSYTNATVTVEDGCIVHVQSGRVPQYTPDPCCAPVGGGAGGGDGEPGPPGPPGAGATVTVGTVTGIPYGQAPRVENVGTSTNAVLDFYLPRGEQGQQGEGGTGGGGDTAGSGCGWELEDGLLKQVPLDWPPITSLNIDIIPAAQGILGSFSKSGCDATVSLDFTSLLNRIANLENIVADLQNQQGGGVTPGNQMKDVIGRACFFSSNDRWGEFRIIFNATTGIAEIIVKPGEDTTSAFVEDRLDLLAANGQVLYIINNGAGLAHGSVTFSATQAGYDAIDSVKGMGCRQVGDFGGG